MMRPPPTVEQMHREEQRIHRQHENDRRQHLACQHEQPERGASGVMARKGIGHRRGDRQCDRGRPYRRDHAVEEIAGEIVVDEDLDEVVEVQGCPFRWQLVGGELVGQCHACEPNERQQN